MNKFQNKLNFLIYTLSGIIAPVIFVLVFTIEGYYRPNYSWVRNFISELSIGDRGWIQITNFLVFGGLIFIFGLGMYREFQKRNILFSGPTILIIIAGSYFISGLFITDPGTVFTKQKSVHGIIHGVFGAIVFTLMPICCWVFFRQFKKKPVFKALLYPTLVASILETIGVMFFTFTSKIPSIQSELSNWNGLIQRIAIVPFMVWLCYLAFMLSSNREFE
jgi:hypothetical membrane protein